MSGRVCVLPLPVCIIEILSKWHQSKWILDPFNYLPPEPAVQIHALHPLSSCRSTQIGQSGRLVRFSETFPAAVPRLRLPSRAAGCPRPESDRWEARGLPRQGRSARSRPCLTSRFWVRLCPSLPSRSAWDQQDQTMSVYRYFGPSQSCFGNKYMELVYFNQSKQKKLNSYPYMYQTWDN